MLEAWRIVPSSSRSSGGSAVVKAKRSPPLVLRPCVHGEHCRYVKCSQAPGPQRDPRDVRRIERLKRDKAKLIEERDRWKRRSEQLEKELEAARRAGKRQAAPFAKDRRQGSGERPGHGAVRTTGSRGGASRPRASTRSTGAGPDELSRLRRRGPTGCRRSIRKSPAVQALVRRFDIESATARGVGGGCRAGRAADLRRLGRRRPPTGSTSWWSSCTPSCTAEKVFWTPSSDSG